MLRWSPCPLPSIANASTRDDRLAERATSSRRRRASLEWRWYSPELTTSAPRQSSMRPLRPGHRAVVCARVAREPRGSSPHRVRASAAASPLVGFFGQRRAHCALQATGRSRSTGRGHPARDQPPWVSERLFAPWRAASLIRWRAGRWSPGSSRARSSAATRPPSPRPRHPVDAGDQWGHPPHRGGGRAALLHRPRLTHLRNAGVFSRIAGIALLASCLWTASPPTGATSQHTCREVLAALANEVGPPHRRLRPSATAT
jgi:hypothetical protein